MLLIGLSLITIPVMKKHFNKEFATTKDLHGKFKPCKSWWICENNSVEGDVKETYHRHISRKYGDASHRGNIINVSLN